MQRLKIRVVKGVEQLEVSPLRDQFIFFKLSCLFATTQVPLNGPAKVLRQWLMSISESIQIFHDGSDCIR